MIVVEKYSVQSYSLQFSNGQLMCTFIWNNWNPFNSWSFVYHFVMRWHEQKKGSDVKRTNFMNIINSYECVHLINWLLCVIYITDICNLMVHRLFSLYLKQQMKFIVFICKQNFATNEDHPTSLKEHRIVFPMSTVEMHVLA